MSKYEYKTEPLEHQRKILRDSWNQEMWGLFGEMGVGKTKIILDNTAALYELGRVTGLLVISPKGPYLNWLGEIKDHLPDRIPRHVVAWQSNKTKAFAKQLNKLWDKDGKLHIFVVNVEALSSKDFSNAACETAWKFVNSHITMFAIDESTSVKSDKASRTKSCLRLAKKCDYRRILTGTPVTESPLDLWGQACVLAGGSPEALLGHVSYYGYRNHYCELKNRIIPGRRPFVTVEGYRNLSELGRVISHWSSRVTKSECLDLPQKTYTRCNVEMTPEQAKLYAKVREEAVVGLGGAKKLTIQLAISRIMRLRQVLSGFLPVDPEPLSLFDYSGEDFHHDPEVSIIEVPERRTEALLQDLEVTQGPVLIWACFRRSVGKLVDVLGKTYGTDTVGGYSGATKPQDRVALVERFQSTDDPLKYLVLNRAGAFGLTLTAAHAAKIYENDWSLEVRMQLEDRCHRIGTKRSVSYTDFVVPGTVDEKLLNALRAKKNVSGQIMREEVLSWI